MRTPSEIPTQYTPIEAEKKWRRIWQETNIFRWDPSRPRAETYVVDTPPPTVSGSLHVGHAFSYTQTDILVRYKRMTGMNIMYPMGWDDNGLPTERRVQNKFGISCDANLPYDPAWKPTTLEEGAGKPQNLVGVSRRNFIEACSLATLEDEQTFKELWEHLALSVEWQQEYATVGKQCIHTSQLSFLDLHKKGYVYQTVAPTIWDVTFKTAVAQAELEDRDVQGHFHDLRFGVQGGGSFVIATTRPELLAACIAVVAHPNDERYKPLFGKQAVTPLFGISVPICPSEHADPEKGSGIMMVCTFGDGADVTWWKSSGLAPRLLVGRDGRFIPYQFNSPDTKSTAPDAATKAYAQIAGKTIRQARKIIVDLLKDPSAGLDGGGAALIGEPKPLTHPVKFYEKGDLPVEFVASRQWYIRIVDYKAEFLEQGRKIKWTPEHMRSRYEHWVTGLAHDWCISRQRFFGVPFPVWYPLDAQGAPKYDSPILATPESLPVDPLSQSAPGYTENQRNIPGGFCGDPDVMDTWATSSMTPQIVSNWRLPTSRHDRLFPMDLRPQAHEIIRTWAFYTIVKAWMHEREIPWKQVAISGWILDPDRKKMSKSKGNTVTPGEYIVQYSADGVRYWAARAKLGIDTALDTKVFSMGWKLSTKLFNASRFVLGILKDSDSKEPDLSFDDVKNPLDRAWLAKLREVVKEATESFEALNYAGALNTTEGAFWDFCDNYLEIVKIRAYQGADDDKRSALTSLRATLDVFLRLFAPFMPYVTEEMWQHLQASPSFQSIHLASWPNENDLPLEIGADESSYDLAVKITDEVRRMKSQAGKGGGFPVAKLEVRVPQDTLPAVQGIIADVITSSRVISGGLTLIATMPDGSAVSEIQVAVELAPPPPPPPPAVSA